MGLIKEFQRTFEPQPIKEYYLYNRYQKKLHPFQRTMLGLICGNFSVLPIHDSILLPDNVTVINTYRLVGLKEDVNLALHLFMYFIRIVDSELGWYRRKVKLNNDRYQYHVGTKGKKLSKRAFSSIVINKYVHIFTDIFRKILGDYLKMPVVKKKIQLLNEYIRENIKLDYNRMGKKERTIKNAYGKTYRKILRYELK